MAKINIEFDGKIYSVDENTLASLVSPLEKALIQQLAGTGAVIRLGDTNYNVDANKLASARNVLTDHLGTVAGTDSKVTVNGTEYGLSKTKLQGATDKMNKTLADLYRKPSEGLAFMLNEDAASYSVTGLGNCHDEDLVIPSSYRGLPVTRLKGRQIWTYDSYYSYYYDVGTFGYESRGNSLYGEHIKTVIIPDSITTIDSYCFSGCMDLHTIVIGSGVTTIGEGIFNGCNSLRNIYIANDETSDIGQSTDWANISATIHWNSTQDDATDDLDYEIPVNPEDYSHSEGLEFVWNSDLDCYAVSSIGTCADTEITVPCRYMDKLVRSIGNHAFANNTTITKIIVPNDLLEIGEGAFQNCANLTQITPINELNNRITIKDYAFSGCINFNSDGIINKAIMIGKYAFENCGGLQAVSLVNVSKVGSFAFVGCSNITKVYAVAEYGISNWSGIQFENAEANPVYYSGNLYCVTSEGFHLSPTGSIPIPECVSIVNDYTFAFNTHLSSISLPNTISKIGKNAFEHCIELTTINIPNSVTEISDYAFKDCANLRDIYIDNIRGTVECGEDWYPEGATVHWLFDEPGSNDPNDPNVIYSEGLEYKLNANRLSYSVTGIGTCADTNLVIPNRYNDLPITDIADNAFAWNSSIETVIIGDNISTIGSAAFQYSCIKQLTIGDSVRHIVSDAFLSTGSLKDIYIKQDEGTSNLNLDWYTLNAGMDGPLNERATLTWETPEE